MNNLFLTDSVKHPTWYIDSILERQKTTALLSVSGTEKRGTAAKLDTA
jgi:hypothetical protein